VKLQPVFQCIECGRFADHAKTDCPCRFERVGDEPSVYVLVGQAEFYHDETRRYRFRLDTFRPELGNIGVRAIS